MDVVKREYPTKNLGKPFEIIQNCHDITKIISPEICSLGDFSKLWTPKSVNRALALEQAAAFDFSFTSLTDTLIAFSNFLSP